MSFFRAAYREAGISFTRYCQLSAMAIRQSTKEPFRSDAILKTDMYRYTIKTWPKGVADDDVKTNYTDEEKITLEEFVVDHKNVLEPRKQKEGEGDEESK